MAQIIKDLISRPLAGETLAQNDAVYISKGTGADSGRTAGKAYKLDITIDERKDFAGFSKEAAVLDDYIKMVTAGRVKNFTGLTQGDTIWAHASTPGAYTSTEPSVSVPLGIATTDKIVSCTSSFGRQDNLSGKSIIAPEKMEAKTDTLANLTTYATTATNGEQVFASDTKEAFQVIDGVLVAIGGGSGGGGLDTFDTEDFEDSGFTVESSGNNASFDGGGTLDGTVSLETGSPISKTQSFKYTAGSSSNNDYVEIKTIDLDLKQRGRDVLIRLSADMSGFANDVTVISYRKTATAKVISSTLDILVASKSRDFYEYLISVPSDCTQISFGVHMNNGATNTESFLIDDIEHSTRPSGVININLMQTMTMDYIDTISISVPSGGLIKLGTTEYNNLYTNGTSGLITKSQETSSTRFTFNKKGYVTITGSIVAAVSNEALLFRKNGSPLNEYAAVGLGAISVPVDDGDYIEPYYRGSASTITNMNMSIEFQSYPSEHVITPAKSGSQTYSITTAGNTLLNLAHAVQFNGALTATINNDTQYGEFLSVDHSTDPSTWTAIAPCIVDVSWSAKFTSGGGANAQVWKNNIITQEGSNNTGANTQSGVSTTISLGIGDFFSVGSDSNVTSDASLTYLRISASPKEVAFLAAVPVQKVAYLKDVKPSGTTGGTFTSGAWRTRDINTVEGDTEIVSVSANQFILGKGKYIINGESQSWQVSLNKLKIRNITNSTDDIVGTSETAGSNGNTANLSGSLTLLESTTFELQHRSSSTKATDGFGFPSSFSVDEIYSTIKITKLR